MSTETLKKSRFSGFTWSAVLFENKELSMGRLMCWVVFFIHVGFWVRGMKVPQTMFDILLVLFTYNFGKKFTGPLAEVLKTRLGSSTSGTGTGFLKKPKMLGAETNLSDYMSTVTSPLSPPPAPKDLPVVAATRISIIEEPFSRDL